MEAGFRRQTDAVLRTAAGRRALTRFSRGPAALQEVVFKRFSEDFRFDVNYGAMDIENPAKYG